MVLASVDIEGCVKVGGFVVDEKTYKVIVIEQRHESPTGLHLVLTRHL